MPRHDRVKRADSCVGQVENAAPLYRQTQFNARKFCRFFTQFDTARRPTSLLRGGQKIAIGATNLKQSPRTPTKLLQEIEPHTLLRNRILITAQIVVVAVIVKRP